MVNPQVKLVRPFSFSLILTQISSEIYSEYQNFTSGLIFTCKVLNMLPKDLHSLSPTNSCFNLSKFSINLDLKSISFNPGLLGGGCASLANKIKKRLDPKIKNLISKHRQCYLLIHK